MKKNKKYFKNTHIYIYAIYTSIIEYRLQSQLDIDEIQLGGAITFGLNTLEVHTNL